MSAIVGLLLLLCVARIARRRPRRAWLWVIALTVAELSMVATTFAVPVVLALMLAAVIDSFLVARATPARAPWLEAGIPVAVLVTAGSVMQIAVLEAFKSPSSSMVPTLEIGDHVMADKLSLRWRPPGRGEIVVFKHPCNPNKDFLKRVVAIAGDTVEVRCSQLYVNGQAVPSAEQPGECAYWDHREEDDSGWKKEDSASCYREELGGHRYGTIHEADRPERDRRRAAAGDAAAYEPAFHDFPPVPEGDAGDEVPFRCNNGDARTPEQQARSRGTFAASTPAGTCGPRYHYVVPTGHVFVLGDNRQNSADSRTWGPVPIENVKGRITGIWWSSAEPTGIRWDRLGSID